MNEATITIHTEDISHSDRLRWSRARQRSVQRGRLVCDLIEADTPLSNTVVLDAGCGYGGTSIALCERGADVIAVDRDERRLRELAAQCPDIEIEHSELSALPYPDDSFNLIILQDVIEHVTEPSTVLQEIRRVLRPDGMVYMSTPNRDSALNLLSDPHFGLPLVSTKTREQLRIHLRRHRPSEADRDDLAELLSLDALTRLLHEHSFAFSFINRRAAEALFARPEDVVWSDWHLRAVTALRRSGLHKAALRLVNDKAGFFNRWINPTWYLIGRKTTP